MSFSVFADDCTFYFDNVLYKLIDKKEKKVSLEKTGWREWWMLCGVIDEFICSLVSVEIFVVLHLSSCTRNKKSWKLVCRFLVSLGLQLHGTAKYGPYEIFNLYKLQNVTY